MQVKSYRDLRVWQGAMEMVVMIYEISDKFPAKEMYGLTSQIRRAAVSVPSNLAEGHTRESTKQYLQYLSIRLYAK
jgi:four helix bundle protein